MDTHEIAAERTPLALASPAGLEHVVVELERVIVAQHRLHRGRRPPLPARLASATPLTTATATLTTGTASAPSAPPTAPASRSAIASWRGLRLGLGLGRGRGTAVADLGPRRVGIGLAHQRALRGLDRLGTALDRSLRQLVGLTVVGRAGGGVRATSVAVAAAA